MKWRDEPAYSIRECDRCDNENARFRLCDVEGCERDATCGTPTDAGYKSTCGYHVPNAEVLS